MSPKKDLIILDLDETVLDMHLDGDAMRPHLLEIFKKQGFAPELNPLYLGIEQFFQSQNFSDPKISALQDEVWSWIEDHELRCAQTKTTVMEGAQECLAQLKAAHMVIYSNNSIASIHAALKAVGLEKYPFYKIIGRTEKKSLKPGVRPLLEVIASLAEQTDRMFYVGDSLPDALTVKNLKTQLPKEKEVHFVMLNENVQKLYELEKQVPGLIGRNWFEIFPLLTTPKLPLSLSVVLLSFNESESVQKAIEDVKRIEQLYLDQTQTLVIDDGSTDDTKAKLDALSGFELIVHSKNQGMGGGMVSGYPKATCEFVVALPADRQVRAQHLVGALSKVKEGVVVHSLYDEGHSGKTRSIMSVLFRLLVVYVSWLKKDFAGFYIFETKRLHQIPPTWKKLKTFLLSFVVLQELSKLDLTFETVTIKAFRREFGTSKEATHRGIKRVMKEIFYYRFLKLKEPFYK